MAYKNSIAVYIDGINRTASVVMPLKWGNFLDERLDECHLALRAVKKEVFAPLTPVEIKITNECYFGIKTKRTEALREETKYFVIANDASSEMQVGKGLYNHDLTLIEVTKVAECYVVDTLTFTNDLGINYTKNAPYEKAIWE